MDGMADKMNIEQGNQNNINKEYYDLASAVNATKEFSGTSQDDKFMWELELLMYVDLYSLSENCIKRLIISKVRREAQAYLASTLKEQPWLTHKEIFAALKQQFSNTEITHQ
ncbi:hypothetical protein COBT_003631, partial [Conglomerata obtusa]